MKIYNFNKFNESATSKANTISRIKNLLSKHGQVTVYELDMDGAPIYSRNGKDDYSTVEAFNQDSIKVSHYIHEIETEEFTAAYEDLSEETLIEIFDKMIDYFTSNDPDNDELY